MPDHPDGGPFDEATLTDTLLEPEAARLRIAAARVRALARIELELLEQAVRAPDDDSARRLELQADTVWRDALALSGEHVPDPPYWLREDTL